MNRSAQSCWTRHHRIHRAARVIAGGGVVAYPTEAVWGLGCDPFNADAVARILDLKGRAMAKGVILIAADLDQLRPFIGALDTAAWQRLAAADDKPITWVVPAGPLAPMWITGGRDTIALRITAHPVAAALCRVVGTPLVSTSANPGGRVPARSVMQVRRYFRDQLDDIVPGSVGAAARPSEIRDIRSGQILRSGG